MHYSASCNSTFNSPSTCRNYEVAIALFVDVMCVHQLEHVFSQEIHMSSGTMAEVYHSLLYYRVSVVV